MNISRGERKSNVHFSINNFARKVYGDEVKKDTKTSNFKLNYSDVIIIAMVSEITGDSITYSIVYSGENQSKL